MRLSRLWTLGAIIPLLTTAIPNIAAAQMSEADKNEIVERVIERLKSDPSIALSLMETLQQSRQQQIEAAQAITPQPRMMELTEGNPDGDIIIMDFADYSCDVCNAQSREFRAAAAENTRIKVVLRDLPTTSADATEASVDLIAAATAGRDWKSLRSHFLNGWIKPEQRITALDQHQTSPSEGDREAARLVLQKNAALAARAGIETLPAAIIMIGSNVSLLPLPMDRLQIKAHIEGISDNR